MRFRLHTLHKDSGESKVFEVEAPDEKAALAMASRSNYLVEAVRPLQERPSESKVTSHTGSTSSFGWIPLAVSLAALSIAAAALGWSVLANPLGSGLNSYDMSSPETAIVSLLEMKAGGDYRAMLELEQVGDDTQEKIATLKIHKRSEYAGKIVLFISYEDNGISTYEISAFERQAESGIWMPTYLSAYSIDDDDLSDAVMAWEAKSGKVESRDE